MKTSRARRLHAALARVLGSDGFRLELWDGDVIQGVAALPGRLHVDGEVVGDLLLAHELREAARPQRGVLVCGSGVGASVAACKLPGIRAAICHDAYSAHQGVEHDDMNVLCLGSEVVGPSLAADLVKTFLNAKFNGGERYVRRLKMIEAMERTAQHA